MNNPDEPRSAILERLEQRGDLISMNAGRLKIEPASGATVPRDWFDNHHDIVVSQIATRLGISVYRYCGYTTGKFGKGRYPGVHLRFRDLADSSDVYVVFNAKITRSRSTRYGNEGSPLPQGHFRVEKESKFAAFWRRSGLPFPRRLSSFHDYMGKLEGIIFIAQPLACERLDKGSLQPLTVSSEHLLDRAVPQLPPGKSRTGTRQFPANARTMPPDNGSAFTDKFQSLSALSATGKIQCEKKVNGITGSRNSMYRNNIHILHPQTTDPRTQTTDEWLADYDASDSP